MRGADRGEAEVTKIMAQIRDMKKQLETEQKEAVKSQNASLVALADAKSMYDSSVELVQNITSDVSLRERKKKEIQERIKELNGEKEEFIASKRAIFARWRKSEEHYCDTKKVPYLAFSPANSSCHPLTFGSGNYDPPSLLLQSARSPSIRKPVPPPTMPSPAISSPM